ncbi:Translation initiation factor 2 [Methanosarcina siciliae C2J]|uniref:Probable translation initiation factor IF-2 n=1 Tax=Methanosarcina siciliae C2J TaxID=1434118 RepID=A0A0E3PNJ9_9EURY|nr:translation initiation factor IF-2 [Methanosarcina siciliae]AKB36675.1 Translation initiation factor 2 [Methanosarcina siciliae C2J]
MTDKKNLRTPIVCVMGHVDHGKTTLLDKIRGTAIVSGEAGAITQHIGATEVPIDVIVNKLGDPRLRDRFMVPGLLFIDTPGHHAFTTLRSRGGALADLAIVVVDINEGFKPQTYESLQILKRFKTPFVVVANKIDRIGGWASHKDMPFAATFKQQSPDVQGRLETKLYEVIGELYNQGFAAERYDRVTNFQKTLGVVPASAVTGEGIPDVLMVLLGLAQKFLEANLQYSAKNPGIGTVLEVKEEKGLGATLDVILYDGTLKKGDTVVIGSLGEPIRTKVRALLKPRELSEIRYESKFKQVSKVTAAAGVKISAPGLEGALAGSPIRVATEENLEEIVAQVKSEIDEVRIDTGSVGVMIKADTLGSLEALVHEFQKDEVPIRKAEVGDISHRDAVEASTVEDPLYSVLIGFNVKVHPDARDFLQESTVKVFTSDVIYRLVEDYQKYVKEQQELAEKKIFETIIRPGKFKILPGCVFRQSKPAVVGVRVLGGVVRTNADVMLENGNVVGKIKGLQSEGENISSAKVGKEVAMAIEGATVGRQIKEEDVLYVNVPERHAKVLEHEIYDSLSTDEKETLDIFLTLKRKGNPFWAK